MDTNKLVTVSGPPASGTSTLSNFISDKINAEVVSGGDIFYQLAEENNMTPREFSKLAEQDPSYDKKIDDKIRSLVQDYESKGYERLVVDSRLAGWHASDVADLKICLKAPLSVRVDRINDRDESIEDLKVREQSERERYMEYYGIDVEDWSVYDIVIDTHKFTQSTVEDLVTSVLSDI